MHLNFHKYQGTGNDFILIDGKSLFFKHHKIDKSDIAWLCDRKFGIGGDGLIIINQKNLHFDFEMEYYNANGELGTMCGNGSRCAFKFAQKVYQLKESAKFNASDGAHYIKDEEDNISLLMGEVHKIEPLNKSEFILDTGSPHFVKIVNEPLPIQEVIALGHAIRTKPNFLDKGINVNFVSLQNHQIFVQTYERGVESMTLSCGTGVTASAIVAHRYFNFPNQIKVEVPGGKLEVSFESIELSIYKNIYLKGPAKEVFNGKIKILKK